MKIVWLASWYPNPVDPFDGDFIQRHAQAVARVQPITVFHVSQSPANDRNYQSDLVNNGVREILFGLGATPFSGFLKKALFNWRYYRAYKRLIRQYIREEGIPDLVHVHVPLKAGIVARWMRRKWKIPYVVSEHAAHYGAGSRDDFFNRSKFHQRRTATVFRHAAAVTNVSQYFADRLQRIFKLKKVFVVPNTVDERLFAYSPAPPSRFRFIHVSTLFEHQKNITGMLQAVRQLLRTRKDFELEIVGPATTDLLQISTEAALKDHVKLMGELPYQAVGERMGQASAFLIFSRYENFPCVVIEALCSGLPVLAAAVGGIGEAIDNKNGILVTSENIDELTAAMSRMIDNYGEFDRAQIAVRAAGQYGYSTIGDAFVRLYQLILESKRQ